MSSPISSRNLKICLTNTLNMDPKEHGGKNWPKLPPATQLAQLVAYRDYCRTKDEDHQFIAEDYFCKAVVDSDLVTLYMKQEAAKL
jgi:hypothetical protein